MLGQNGMSYEVLEEAAKSIKGVSGLTCEIGLREGGGTKLIIDSLISVNDFNRTHICIDPFGHLPYPLNETQIVTYDYTNHMRNQAMWELYAYIDDKKINVLFFPLEDFEFFNRFADGVPVYEDSKRMMNQYALVYFDGPHTLAITMNETEFFEPRAPKGAIFVYDDIHDYYDHSKIKEYLTALGWEEIIATNHKASYRKQ
jgi:hypothetical protein